MSEMTLQDLVKGSGKKEIELGEKEIYETALRILAEHGMHPNMMPDNHPEENEEEKKKKEEEMNRNILASLESLGLAEVQEIAKKAREIQEPGEPWMDAMKRASKMMEEQKMSEQEQARIEALEKKVAEMTAKNDELLKKLDEPDKTKIVLRDDKKIEIPRDVDQGMLDYLKSLGGE